MNKQIEVTINRKLEEPETVLLFNPDGQFLGYINENQLCDIQIQIVENRLEGYFIREFNKKPKIKINKLGELKTWPECFTLTQKMFQQLLKARRKQK